MEYDEEFDKAFQKKLQASSEKIRDHFDHLSKDESLGQLNLLSSTVMQHKAGRINMHAFNKCATLQTYKNYTPAQPPFSFPRHKKAFQLESLKGFYFL